MAGNESGWLGENHRERLRLISGHGSQRGGFVGEFRERGGGGGGGGSRKHLSPDLCQTVLLPLAPLIIFAPLPLQRAGERLGPTHGSKVGRRSRSH